MRGIVIKDKKLSLCYQKQEWYLDAYTKEFMACMEVCEEVGSNPDECLELAKIMTEEAGDDGKKVNKSEHVNDIVKIKKYITQRQ